MFTRASRLSRRQGWSSRPASQKSLFPCPFQFGKFCEGREAGKHNFLLDVIRYRVSPAAGRQLAMSERDVSGSRWSFSTFENAPFATSCSLTCERDNCRALYGVQLHLYPPVTAGGPGPSCVCSSACHFTKYFDGVFSRNTKYIELPSSESVLGLVRLMLLYEVLLNLQLREHIQSST